MTNGEIVKQQGLNELLESINSLSVEEKALLVSKLLGQQPGVSVVFGNGSNHVLRADLVVQINNSDTEGIRTITDAIARRIEKG